MHQRPSRLYAPEAESQVRFIQRAQRLGFSLTDIRQLMDDQSADADVLALAEARFMALERSLTELLVQQHEMQLFLRDMQTSGRDDRLYRTLSERVCSGTTAPPALWHNRTASAFHPRLAAGTQRVCSFPPGGSCHS